MSKRALGPKPLLLPLPVVIVGVRLEDRVNYLTVSYCGMLGDEPPVIALGIGSQALTHEWIRSAGGFSVNIPPRSLVAETDYVGIVSGRDVDKSGVFTTFYGRLGDVPMAAECPVNMECRAVAVHEFGDMLAWYGEIIETHVDKSCLEGDAVDTRRVDPFVLIPPIPHYVALGDTIAEAFEVGRNLSPGNGGD